MAVDGKISLRAALNHSSAYDLGSLTAQILASLDITLESGTGASQADMIFADERTLAASATENLDLAGGLTDAFGASMTFAKVKAIIVLAASGNTNDVVVGAGTNPFVGPLGGTTPTVSVKPGGMFVAAHPGTGWTVTASTGDILKVANSAGTTGVTYKIIIIGTSA